MKVACNVNLEVFLEMEDFSFEFQSEWICRTQEKREFDFKEFRKFQYLIWFFYYEVLGNKKLLRMSGMLFELLLKKLNNTGM